MLLELTFIAFQWIREKLHTDKVLLVMSNIYRGFKMIFFGSSSGNSLYGGGFELYDRNMSLKERLDYYNFKAGPGTMGVYRGYDEKCIEIVLYNLPDNRRATLSLWSQEPILIPKSGVVVRNWPMMPQPTTPYAIENTMKLGVSSRDQLYRMSR